MRQVDQPPYTVVGEVPPFSRSQTSFARARGGGHRSVAEIVAEGHEGYTRMDFAVANASWTVAATMGHLAYSWERLEGARGTQGEYAELPRHEPDDPTTFTGRIKEAAQLYGAGAVGICGLDRRWLYADDDDDRARQVPEDFDKAIVVAVPMDRERVMLSPAAAASAASGNGYSRMAFTAACVAELLRDLGWRAIPCGNDTALSIPLAVDAGLGEMGRNGLLIHPRLGPCLRLCKVLTDAPLVPDKPIEFGVRERCERCRRCVAECEVGAITDGEMSAEPVCPANNTGVLKWQVNGDLCLDFWHANGTNCSNCVKACPYMPAGG